MSGRCPGELFLCQAAPKFFNLKTFRRHEDEQKKVVGGGRRGVGRRCTSVNIGGKLVRPRPQCLRVISKLSSGVLCLHPRPALARLASKMRSDIRKICVCVLWQRPKVAKAAAKHCYCLLLLLLLLFLLLFLLLLLYCSCMRKLTALQELRVYPIQRTCRTRTDPRPPRPHWCRSVHRCGVDPPAYAWERERERERERVREKEREWLSD